ncbi:MAG: CHAT domain-containing protein [Aestuariibaculum sp.]
MKRYIVLLIYFFYGNLFTQNIEESIYTATERFISNQNTTSLEQLNKAEAHFKNTIKTKDEQLALVFLQCNKAFYLSSIGFLQEAITSYENASNLFFDNKLEFLSDFDIIESCLNPLGNLYIKIGDFTNAISTINQYIFLAEQNHNTPQQISGAINLAILYQTIGNHKMAIKTTEKYIEKTKDYKQLRQKLIQINTDSQIALGSISNYNDIPIALINKAGYKLAFNKKDYNKALTFFDKIKKELLSDKETLPRDVAKLYFQEAQLYHLLDNKTETTMALQKALNILLPNNNTFLPDKDSLYAENTFIDVFDLYAATEPDTEKALQAFNLSFHVSYLLQNQYTSQENKIRLQATNRTRSETCIDLLYNAFKTTKNKSLLKRAFQYAENNKASVLRTVSEKQKRLTQHPRDSLLIQESIFLKEQEYITGKLLMAQLANDSISKINRFGTALNRISIQLKRLQEKIEKKYPSETYLISIEKLQQQLQRDNTVFVEYFFGKRHVYQFIISGNDIALNGIPFTETFKYQIKSFIQLFDSPTTINNNINTYTKLAHDLYNSLNLKTINRNKNILVIPDGFLNFVPFEALLTSATSTTAFKNMPFLVKTQALAYNSSAYFYLNKTKTVNNHNLLGFFPVFENTQQQLTYSINEAETIQYEIDSDILLRKKATKHYFTQESKKYTILHLSTHASSGTFAIPAHIEFYDNTLFLNELYSLDFSPELVVLSACETGVGSLYKGEGPMSLARGFQYAGTKNLLFSLWQINDLSTAQIMQSFYRTYTKNQSAFVANRQSKLDYLKNDAIDNTKKSPYYWSAFVYYGSIDTVKNSNTLFYSVFTLFIIAIILFLWQKFKPHGQ